MTAHRWTLEGRCAACAMHREWPGARAECPVKPTMGKNVARDRARKERREEPSVAPSVGRARARVRSAEQDRMDADRKRRWRSDPANLARENEWAEARRRAKGVRPAAEVRAEKRALALASAPARREAARERARARKADPAVRAIEAERIRERRAAMTVEERRAEWARHQRAKRERDRLAAQMRQEAAE